jgi:hypothetical protein
MPGGARRPVRTTVRTRTWSRALKARIAELERQRKAPAGTEAAKIASLQARQREIEVEVRKRGQTPAMDGTDADFRTDFENGPSKSAALTPPHQIETLPPLGPDGEP